MLTDSCQVSCFTDGEKLREENLPKASWQPGSYMNDLLGRLLLQTDSLKHHNPTLSLQSMPEGSTFLRTIGLIIKPTKPTKTPRNKQHKKQAKSVIHTHRGTFSPKTQNCEETNSLPKLIYI